jgi:hypothetical protein
LEQIDQSIARYLSRGGASTEVLTFRARISANAARAETCVSLIPGIAELVADGNQH